MLSFEEFSRINRQRCIQGFHHQLDDWTPSEWMVATLGELGEAANVIKKMNRIRDGIPNREAVGELGESLSRELADTFIYLDLLVQSLGLSLEDIVCKTFNAKSKEIGCDIFVQPKHRL